MRAWMSVVAFFVLGAAALFADVGSAVSQLNTDISARIAAIADPSNKESKALQKVLDKLAKYTGKDDVKDLKTLGAAGKLLVASKTEDAAIISDAAAVVQAIRDHAARRRQFIDDEIANLVDPRDVVAVEAAVDSADGLFEDATRAIDNNPVKATALFVKAYDLFGRALKKARTFAELQLGSPPPEGIGVNAPLNSVDLINGGALTYDIKNIRVFATVTGAAGTVSTYTGETVKTLLPDYFDVPGSNRILPATVDMTGTTPTVFPLTPMLQQLIPQGTVSGRIYGQMWITLKKQPFFVVHFDVAGN